MKKILCTILMIAAPIYLQAQEAISEKLNDVARSVKVLKNVLSGVRVPDKINSITTFFFKDAAGNEIQIQKTHKDIAKDFIEKNDISDLNDAFLLIISSSKDYLPIFEKPVLILKDKDEATKKIGLYVVVKGNDELVDFFNYIGATTPAEGRAIMQKINVKVIFIFSDGTTKEEKRTLWQAGATKSKTFSYYSHNNRRRLV